MRKLTILFCVLLLALAGFTYRPDAAEPTPAEMTLSVSEETANVLVVDEAGIRTFFDLYLALRAQAAPAEAGAEPPRDALVYTVCFYEAAKGSGFGLRTWEGGPVQFFGEEDQPENASLQALPAPSDPDLQALLQRLRAFDLTPLTVTAPQPEEDAPEPAPLPAEEPRSADGPAVRVETLEGSDIPAPAARTDDADAPSLLPIEPMEGEEPAGEDAPDEAASQEMDAASGESSEEAVVTDLPGDITELLGRYDIAAALGGAQLVDMTTRTDPDAAPLWAAETEHTGAEVAVYYARELDQTELRWQRWWSDETRAESVTAEEFQNARAFYRESMPGFMDGLSVGGSEAFFFDMFGDATLMWYDAGRDLIFQITAYAGSAAAAGGADSEDSAAAWELIALAGSLAG